LNLSALQFRENNLIDILREAISDHGIEASLVELELTESVVMQNPKEAEKTMRAFREMGFRLSLDDFGTGYSSLAYLKRFPFDNVKIDRAFVIDITRNPEDAAIASAIIGMAHSLRMKVVAEGVETEAQLKFLRTRHCDQMQGYFFSRPIPAEDFGLMLYNGEHLEVEQDPGIEEQILLIVDDDHGILSSLNRCLRGQGYRILNASNGYEGLEILASNAVKVIICSQRMPTMSGVDFLTIAAKLYPDTMRIILSGYTELQSVLDAVNRGEIYRFLTKPWDDDQLRKNIHDAFRRYRRTI
jgi:CheY-like chemotaxis protein